MPFDPISAGISAGASLIGTGVDWYYSSKNLELQKEQLAYQKWLQQQIFAREDTAVQRKRKDLEAAGMSPFLAAGEGANAGSVVQSEAPQRELPNIDEGMIGAALDAMIKNKQARNLDTENDKTKAEIENIKSTTKHTDTTTTETEKNIDLKQKEIDNFETEKERRHTREDVALSISKNEREKLISSRHLLNEQISELQQKIANEKRLGNIREAEITSKEIENIRKAKELIDDINMGFRGNETGLTGQLTQAIRYFTNAITRTVDPSVRRTYKDIYFELQQIRDRLADKNLRR